MRSVPTSCPAPRRAALASDPPGRGRPSERCPIQTQAPGLGPGFGSDLRPGPPRPPAQRLLLGTQVCEALSLSRQGWPPALRLRAGPSLARQHERHIPAARGSGGGGGGGLAGQKQHFRGPGRRALRGRHHHHGPSVCVDASARRRRPAVSPGRAQPFYGRGLPRLASAA